MDYIDDRDRITQQRIALEKHIGDYLSVVVGFSAGVDSSVVAAAAYAALGDNALAVTAITETITDEDVQLADDVAKLTFWKKDETASQHSLDDAQGFGSRWFAVRAAQFEAGHEAEATGGILNFEF